jgi:hypothetical protein
MQRIRAFCWKLTILSSIHIEEYSFYAHAVDYQSFCFSFHFYSTLFTVETACQQARAAGTEHQIESSRRCAAVGLACPVWSFHAWRSAMQRTEARACTAAVVESPAAVRVAMKSAGVMSWCTAGKPGSGWIVINENAGYLFLFRHKLGWLL